MPELPEIRAHAHRLDEAFRGATLTAFRAISFTALKTVAPDPRTAIGEPVVEIGSRGKFLLVAFAPVTFVVHLMQGGRLVPDEKQSAKPRNGMARWVFDDHDALLLTEAGRERKAGIWVVTNDAGPHDISTVEHLHTLGPDADRVSLDELTAIAAEAGASRLHGVLRNQRRLAGLGRRLANEICWTARLSPFATTNRLAQAQLTALRAAIIDCIEESYRDELTRDHMARSADRVAHVHHRAGEPCDRCGDVIREVEYRSYVVDYCATCQTGGKVLADNTTSRFLK